MSGLVGKVFVATGYDNDTNEQILSARTLLDSSMAISVTETLARAGQNGAIIGVLYDASDVMFTLTDQQWDLNYLAMKFGGAITSDTDMIKVESFTVAVANTIVAQNEVYPFTQESGTIGWYKRSEDDDSKYQKITFIDGTAIVEGLSVGTTVCVKYPRVVVNSRELIVNSDFAPKIIRLTLETPILKSSAAESALKSATKIGNLVIDVPQFQFNPTQDSAFGQSSYASTQLTGRALESRNTSCDGSAGGTFCKIKEEYFGADDFTGVRGLAIVNGAKSLIVNETLKLDVLRIFQGLVTPSTVPNYANLTFTSSNPAVATVGADGVVTAVSAGEAIIEVVATAQPNLNVPVTVEVTA